MFQGVTFDTERFLSRIFRARASPLHAQGGGGVDATHKQLIPYVMMASQGKYLSYVRGKQGGEKRLVGNRSIGISRHINPADDLPLFSQLAGYSREAYLTRWNVRSTKRCLWRVATRTPLSPCSMTIPRRWAECTWASSTTELATPSVNKREQMITQLDFLGVEELHRCAIRWRPGRNSASITFRRWRGEARRGSESPYRGSRRSLTVAVRIKKKTPLHAVAVLINGKGVGRSAPSRSRL